MSNEMKDWQADEIQELQGRIKELEAIMAIRSIRIAPEPLDMERWVQLSHCAVLEAEKTSTPDAPRNPGDTLYYWAFQTLAIQESAITDQQARIAELQTEVQEQARLLDMSATRELGFIASLSTMEAALSQSMGDHVDTGRALKLARAQLAELREAAGELVANAEWDGDISTVDTGDLKALRAELLQETPHD